MDVANQNALRNLGTWLKTFHGTNETLAIYSWRGLTEPDALLLACRAALDSRDSEILLELWGSYDDTVVRRFLDYYYATQPACFGADVDVEQVHDVYRGFVRATVDVAIRRKILPDTTLATERSNAEPPWLRDIEHALVGEKPRAVVHRVRLAVLGVKMSLAPSEDSRARSSGISAGPESEQEEFVAYLNMELLDSGSGRFYPDPKQMGLLPMTRCFQQAVDDAFQATKRVARLPSGMDIRWSILGDRKFLKLLEGPSIGLPMAVCLTRLLERGSIDERIAMTGEIRPDGSVGSVSGVYRKVIGAIHNPRPQIDCVLVPVGNRKDAFDAAESVCGEPTIIVQSVENLARAMAVVRQPLPGDRDFPGERAAALTAATRHNPWPWIGAPAVMLLTMLAVVLPSVWRPHPSPIPPGPDRGKTPPADVQFFKVKEHFEPHHYGDIGDLKVEVSEGDLDRFECTLRGEGKHEHYYKYLPNESQENPQPAGWVGRTLLSGGWGAEPEAGWDLREFKRLHWDARSTGEPVWVKFLIGGANWQWQKQLTGWKREPSPYADSMPTTQVGESQLTREWQCFTYDLPVNNPAQLRRVVNGFAWQIIWGSNGVSKLPNGRPVNPRTFNIEISHLRYER